MLFKHLERKKPLYLLIVSLRLKDTERAVCFQLYQTNEHTFCQSALCFRENFETFLAKCKENFVS